MATVNNEESLPSTDVDAAVRRFRLRDDVAGTDWFVAHDGKVTVRYATGHTQEASRFTLWDLKDTDRFVEIVEPVQEEEGVVALSTDAPQVPANFVIDTHTLPAVGVTNCCTSPTELALYRTFHTEALAAHAHASPSRVEIEFGRACDRLRAGLKAMRGQAADELAAESQRLGLYGAPKEEESLSSQTMGAV